MRRCTYVNGDCSASGFEFRIVTTCSRIVCCQVFADPNCQFLPGNNLVTSQSANGALESQLRQVTSTFTYYCVNVLRLGMKPAAVLKNKPRSNSRICVQIQRLDNGTTNPESIPQCAGRLPHHTSKWQSIDRFYVNRSSGIRFDSQGF